MKATPGPYIALDNFIYSMHIDQHMKQVADCDTAETAKFVSAAPELLEALNNLCDAIDRARTTPVCVGYFGDQDIYYNSADFGPSFDIARAAIKKAKGE